MKKFLSLFLSFVLMFSCAMTSLAYNVKVRDVKFYVQVDGVQMDSNGDVNPRPVSYFSGVVAESQLTKGTRKDTFTVAIGNGVTQKDILKELTSVPDDDSVFVKLRSEFEKTSYIRANTGEIVSWDALTSENYRTEWYVLKFEASDNFWHIDGRVIDRKTDENIQIVVRPEEPEKPEKPEVPKDDEINLHGVNYAYIFGYEPYTDANGGIVLDMAMDDAVTSEQVCAMIMRMIDQTYNNKNVNYEVSSKVKPYEGTWFERGLAYIDSKGGFDDIDKIKIGRVTRGEVAKLITYGLNLTKSVEVDYTDVADSQYLPYIKIMTAYGYMKGVSDTEFEPDRIMTRAEFCSLFNNIIGRNEMGLTAVDENGSLYEITAETYEFTDMDSSHWAYDICLKATSAYNEKGYVDLELRADNIRNKLDHYDSQMQH